MRSRAALLGAVGAGAVAGLNMAGKKLKKVLDERKARKRDEAKDTFIDGSKVAASKLSPRMAGGMMNKPMGYKHGTMVKARGCKLGRTRPTKMY